MEGWEKKSYGRIGGECIMTEYEKGAIYLDGRGLYRVGEIEKFLKMGGNDI